MIRSRMLFGILAIAMIAPSPAAARPQIHFEMGLSNTGPLATEVTRYVRPAPTPGSLYVGAGIDDRLFGRTYLTVAAAVSLTTIGIVECASDPCAHLGRYARARGRTVAEPTVMLATPRIGLRQDLPGPLDVSAGIAIPILQGPEVYFGATPMGSKAVWGEVLARARVRNTLAAAFARYTAIGPHDVRFTAASEWSGYKHVGEAFPAGTHDPLWITVIEAGARVYTN